MRFRIIITALKQTPILDEFHYWIAAWIAFGQIPESSFLKLCLLRDVNSAMMSSVYSARNYQDIKDWMDRNAPLESYGSECLKHYPIKMQQEAEQTLTVYAEKQHSS